MGSIATPHRKYEAMCGFFSQSEPETAAAGYDYMKHNFGLIDRKYETDEPGDVDSTQWQRFETYARELAKSSETGTSYKVLYVGRHGEGFHNVAEAKYGTKDWDDYWSKLDGDGDLFWFDAHLTEKGKQQAHDNNEFLKRQFADQKMPTPGSHYTSPLYRCLQTVYATYSGLDLASDRPFKPLVKEMAREVLGEHTCDRRSSRTVIHDAFSDAKIEPGFSEEDELWEADHRETHDEHDIRTRRLLDDLFEHDGHVFVSLTSHSGSIASLLRVLGHREFRLQTGGMIPLLVKSTTSPK